MSDYYMVLGLPRSASPEEVKIAYRKQVRLHHPDKVSGELDQARQAGDPLLIAALEQDLQEAIERTQRLNEAYDTLSDVQKRRVYDLNLSLQESVDRDATRPSPPQEAPVQQGYTAPAYEPPPYPYDAPYGGNFYPPFNNPDYARGTPSQRARGTKPVYREAPIPPRPSGMPQNTAEMPPAGSVGPRPSGAYAHYNDPAPPPAAPPRPSGYYSRQAEPFPAKPYPAYPEHPELRPSRMRVTWYQVLGMIALVIWVGAGLVLLTRDTAEAPQDNNPAPTVTLPPSSPADTAEAASLEAVPDLEQLGDDLSEQGDYLAAIDYFDRILAEQESPRVYFKRGSDYQLLAEQTGESRYYAQAEADFLKTIELDPRFASAYRALGTMFYERWLLDANDYFARQSLTWLQQYARLIVQPDPYVVEALALLQLQQTPTTLILTPTPSPPAP